MKHFERIFYIVIGVIITILANEYIKPLIADPDYRIKANIRAPLARVDAWLVDQKTGEKIYIPDTQGPNPIQVLLKNTGKKPIENLEVIMEFEATGDLSLSDEKYSTKPDKGFGSVTFSKPKNTERRVRLGLFNPGDELMYFAIGSRPVMVTTYAKFPGLSFYQQYSPVGQHDNFIRLFEISFFALSSAFGILLFFSVQKMIIEQYGIRNILRRGFINTYWNDRTKKEKLRFYLGFSLALISGVILAKLISNT